MIFWDRVRVRLDPPSEFSFKRKDWEAWKSRFDRYRRMTCLDDQSYKSQIDVLLYTMGLEAENIYKTFKNEDSYSLTYDEVISQFDKYFSAYSNKVHEIYSYIFNL